MLRYLSIAQKSEDQDGGWTLRLSLTLVVTQTSHCKSSPEPFESEVSDSLTAALVRAAVFPTAQTGVDRVLAVTALGRNPLPQVRDCKLLVSDSPLRWLQKW